MVSIADAAWAGIGTIIRRIRKKCSHMQYFLMVVSFAPNG